MVEGDEELCQSVERALTTKKREFFLDLEHGLEHEEFQKKNPSYEKIKLDIAETVLQEERVQKITDLKLSYVNNVREMSIGFIITDENGKKHSQEVSVSESGTG